MAKSSKNIQKKQTTKKNRNIKRKTIRRNNSKRINALKNIVLFGVASGAAYGFSSGLAKVIFS